ncbi:SHOCT domain-containing protein [Aestuariivirga sp.]|uniref:SHOCT domain-containing protein n=1 Tax=Aestuariivirga sp. TaxID=2650926 RepID=UPI0039198F30
MNRRIHPFAVSLAVMLPATAHAQDRYGYGPHMMWGDGGWSMFFFGPLFMILVIAAVVAAVVFLVRALGGSSGHFLPRQSGRAIEILKERYARGEIDTAEFEERRKTLGE